MFKMKKITVDGRCKAMRCMDKAGYVIDGYGLCDRHHAEYKDNVRGGAERLVTDNEFADNAQEIVDAIPNDTPESTALAAGVEAEQLHTDLVGFDVCDQESMDLAGELLQEVKAKHKALDAQRKEATGPINASLKTINGWFKPGLGFLKNCELALKVKIKGHVQLEADNIQAAMQAGDHEAASQPQTELPGGVTARSTWTYEIVDEQKLPGGFYKVDHDKIKSHVQELKHLAEIPGVRVFQTTALAVKS